MSYLRVFFWSKDKLMTKEEEFYILSFVSGEEEFYILSPVQKKLRVGSPLRESYTVKLGVGASTPRIEKT